MHGDRNHLRGSAQFAFDRAMPVLPQRADHLCGITHFRGLVGGSKRSDDFILGDRHFDRAEIEHRVTETPAPACRRCR